MAKSRKKVVEDDVKDVVNELNLTSELKETVVEEHQTAINEPQGELTQQESLVIEEDHKENLTQEQVETISVESLVKQFIREDGEQMNGDSDLEKNSLTGTIDITESSSVSVTNTDLKDEYDFSQNTVEPTQEIPVEPVQQDTFTIKKNSVLRLLTDFKDEHKFHNLIKKSSVDQFINKIKNLL